MSKRNTWTAAFAAVVSLTFAASSAHAQSRTWVSGVGDDLNPCSRTAPCKTFAGAIGKTAAGGEINVLDPGAFGAVTITKSITISSEGLEAGVLAAANGNGIVIQAANSDTVVLRGLDIEGSGTGLTGIKVLSAGKVHVERCTIDHFTQNAIDFVPTSQLATTSALFVSDTIARQNVGASSGGIHVKPGVNVSAKATITRTLLEGNQFGLRVEDNGVVVASETTASGNAGAGFIAVGQSAAAVLDLEGCVAANNGVGIKADVGASSTVHASNCNVVGTAGANNGFVVAAGAHFFSFGNNRNSDGFTGSVTNQLQQ